MKEQHLIAKLRRELEVAQRENTELKTLNASLKQRAAFSPGTKEKEKDG